MGRVSVYLDLSYVASSSGPVWSKDSCVSMYCEPKISATCIYTRTSFLVSVQMLSLPG